MDALSAIKGAPLTVPGYLLGKVGDVAQAVLPDSIGQPISTALHAPLVAGHALEGYGAQSPESQQESQNWLNQVTNETGGGKLAAGLTGLAHGYFNNYLPQTQVQPGTTESMIQGVGNLAGMAANMGGGLATKATTKAIEALAPGLIGKLLPMGVQMGAYGAQTQAPNLTAHMANTAEQAAMSVPFSLGGMLAGGAIKALAPNAPEWLAHLINSGALGAGAGAFQPAQDWQERLKNMGMGAGEFAIAHAINPFNYTSEPLKTGGELYSNNSDMYRIVYPKDNDINNIGAKNEPTTPLEQTTEPQTQPTVSAIEPTEPITEPAGIDLTKLSPKDKELIDKVNAGVYTLDDLTNFQAKRFEKHGIIDKDRNLTEAGATIIKPKPVEAESQPPTPPVEDATTMQTPDTIKDMSDTTKADVGDSTQPDAISPIKKNLTTEKPVAQPESYLDTNPNISQEPEVANKKGNETEGLTKSPNLDVSQSSDADANEPADHLVDANKMVGAQEAAKTAAMSINSQQLRDRLALATENDLPRLEDAKVNIKSHIKNAPNSFVKNRLAAHLNAVNDAMTRIKDIQEFKKDRPILDTMYEQIDMAQAGQRYSIDNPNSMHGDWTGTKSTFPDWAYEGITKKRFFDLYNRATGQDEKGSPLTENMKAELHGLLRYAKEQIERHQGGYVNDTGSMHEQRLEHQKEQLEQQAIESEANRETEKKVDISTLPVEEGDKVKMINKYGNPDTFTYKGVNEKGNMEFQDHYTEEVPLFGEPVKREVLGIEKKPTKDVGFELTAPEPKAAKGKKPVTPDMFVKDIHANAMEGGISGGQEKLTPLETAQRDAEEARAKADEAARQGELPGTTVQEHREKALRVRDNDGNIHTIYEPGAVDHAKVAEIYNVNPQNIVDAGWRLKDGSFQADPKSVLMMMKSWKTNSNRNPDYSVGKQGEGEKAFVKASDGTTDFGEVVEGKKVIPVRLQVGNKLYGKTKIKNKHEKKIQSAGYPDVES
ncbi:MAG: hypothetical protein HQK97_10665, partial [Nitrospirae bacterium]|nr:hypothetical protein [Nitrospirota bacterium]